MISVHSLSGLVFCLVPEQPWVLERSQSSVAAGLANSLELKLNCFDLFAHFSPLTGFSDPSEDNRTSPPDFDVNYDFASREHRLKTWTLITTSPYKSLD